jgi:hypothetical protein
MAITLEAFADVTTVPPVEEVPSLVARVTTQSTADVLADVAVGVDVLSALVVREKTQIVHVGAVVRGPVGFVTLDAQDIVSWRWEEDEEGLLTWEMSVAAQRVDVFDNWIPGPLLTEQEWGYAPPPGPNAVHLTISVETVPGFAQDFVVVGDGLTARASRPLTGSERVLRLSGPGAWGRIDRRPVSLTLPAGHGQTHGEVAGELLELSGLLPSQLPGAFGEPLSSPVEVHCEPGWPEAVRVADGAGSLFRWSQGFTPQLSTVPLVPALSARPVRVLGVQDVLLGFTAEVDVDGDVPVRYVVQGSRSEFPAGGEGAVTTATVVETWDDNYVPPGAYFVQVPSGVPSAGELLPKSPNLTPRRELVSRVTTLVTKVAGCVVAEEVITEGWYSPLAARYRQNVPFGDQDAGDPEYRQVYIYDPDAVQDDQAEGYLDEYFRFVEISRVRKESHWGTIRDASGLTPKQVVILRNDSGDGSVLTAKRPGDLRLRTVFAGGWYNPRRALRNGDQYIDAVNLTAGGVGVLYEHEAYMVGPGDAPKTTTDTPLFPDRRRRVPHWISVERTVFAGDDRGYLTQTNAVTKKWGFDLESVYFFDDEITSGEEWELRVEDPEIDTLYVASGARSHTSAERVLDPKKRLIPNGETITFNGTEYLSRRPHCAKADALAASNRPVSGEHTCGSGAFHDQGDVQVIDHPYVESDAAALARAELECVMDHAPTVTLAILPDPRLRTRDPIVVDLPDAGLYRRRGWIHNVSCEKPARAPGEAGSPVIMTLSIRIDPRT